MRAGKESRQSKMNIRKPHNSRKSIIGMDIPMIIRYMILRSRIFARYHSKFRFLKI